MAVPIFWLTGDLCCAAAQVHESEFSVKIHGIANRVGIAQHLLTSAKTGNRQAPVKQDGARTLIDMSSGHAPCYAAVASYRRILGSITHEPHCWSGSTGIPAAAYLDRHRPDQE
jgi:hypothetical protein